MSVVLLALAGSAGGAGSALAATWSTVTTPNAAGADHSALFDMACEPQSTNACTAVGKKTVAGVSTPYAQYWNGSSWANQTTATPSGATAGELQANTCLSTTSCVAAGHYTTGSGTFSLAESWNGTSWSIQTTPNPSGATDSRLRGVSCAVITACIAVGYSVSGTGVKSAIAQRGNSGTWSLQSLSAPAGATESELQGVECTSSTFCVAVGRYNVNTSTYWAWSATWNGSSWTLRTVPHPSGALRSVLLDVSCTDATDCIAVGAYRNASSTQVSFAARWDGSSWVHQSTPNPAGSSNTVLQNVSCGERNWCVAVGDWLNSATWQTMAQSWNGSAWSLDTTPNPAGATFGIFEGIACRLTCLATGWYTNSSGNDTTLGAGRSAPTWIQRTLPTPLSNEALNDITCFVSNGCFAVGVGAGHAQISFGGTGTWIHFDDPEPSGAVFSQLRGAHCRSPYWCAAVGEYNLSGGSPLPYAATDGDSGGWDVQTVPTPGGASAVLNDVYCDPAHTCMAAGYFMSAGVAKTFSSFWNGSTWSTRTPLNAPGSTENVLNDISCPSSSLDCITVGYARVGGVPQPLVQRWSGSTWAIHTSSIPSGASSGMLFGLSCVETTPTTCMAVGEADAHAYAVRWTGSGSSWTVVTAPHPPFAQASRFENVSCASPTACVAVGHYTLSGGTKKTFAADWDGTGWTLHSTPNPGTSANDLLGVSCTGVSVCRTAGYGNNPSAFNLVATLN